MTAHERTGVTRYAVLATLAASLLAACTGGSGGTTPTSVPVTPDASPSASTAPDATDAASVLAGYGLTLPDGAQGATVEARADDVMTDRYLVTFTVSAADVATMCADAGVNGPLPAGTLLPDELELFEVEQTPEGSRVCSGSADDLQQQIRVLAAGDPAQVRVALFTMPAR